MGATPALGAFSRNVTVEVGSETLSCALVLGDEGSEWGTLDESGCETAELLYDWSGELGVVWPSPGAPLLIGSAVPRIKAAENAMYGRRE